MKKNQSGQSLFEVTLALAIVSLILVTLVALATVSLRNTSLSRNKTISTRIVQETTEWLRGDRDQDWDQFSGRAAIPTWCLQTLNWEEAGIGSCSEDDEIEGTVFKREVSFSLIDSETIEARVRVFWTSPQGVHEARSSTLFTNWKAQ